MKAYTFSKNYIFLILRGTAGFHDNVQHFN